MTKNNSEVSINLVHNKHVDVIKLLIDGLKLYSEFNDKLLELILTSLCYLKKLEDESMISNNFIHDCYKYGLQDMLDYLDENCTNKNILRIVENLKEELNFYDLDNCCDNMEINN